MKSGFNACGRDLLGLDGTFMKGPFPKQVLTAVGVDSNSGIYLVAYEVMEAETIDSWTWFLQILTDDLDLDANSDFTFISGKHKVAYCYFSGFILFQFLISLTILYKYTL